jgi:putative OPT family oligopeptide transporter
MPQPRHPDAAAGAHRPHIPAETVLPENTLRAILLGVVLSAVLAGANAYLGLFAGMTVSASIPAAVLSMAFLRVLGRTNVLENNAVQTAASAGESLAAGVIFTFPALVIMGYWEGFNYTETVFIALSGGVLGVLFTIPLRRALIVRQALLFPEGIATSEVLKTGVEGGRSVAFLAVSALAGGAVKFAEAGLGLWHGVLEKAAFVGRGNVAFFGMNLSPALLAVGYIVGLRIAALVFIGGVITWWVAIPAYLQLEGADATRAALGLGADAGAVDLAGALWSAKLRYLGVGAMVVGGLWALVSIRGALALAVTEGLAAFRKGASTAKTLRTDLDTPMSWVLIGIGVLVVPIFWIYLQEIGQVGITLFMAVVMVVAGFLFSAVAGYMAGLVGSSNNPISGVTIATILSASLMLLVLLGTGGDPGRGAAAAILIGAVVCCAAAIAGDNMQDLKSGYILGATPRNQQVMQVLGVVAAALVLPWVLDVLHTAYTLGSDELAAPQATLMASVATGVFERNLPWDLVAIGAGIAALVIVADEIQRRRGASFRLPVLAVAVGLYLPFELDSAIMLGGLVAWAATRFRDTRGLTRLGREAAAQAGDRTGLLIASGLITGEALLGIGLAIPVAVLSKPDLFPLLPREGSVWLGLAVVLAIAFALGRLALKAHDAEAVRQRV